MSTVLTIRLTRLRIVAALVAALVAAGSAVAIAQTAVLTGGGVTQVKVSRFAVSDLQGVASNTFHDLPGVAPLTVTVPANQKALVKLTLSSESHCGPGDLEAVCRVALQFRKGAGPQTEIKDVLWDSNEPGDIFVGEAHAITATVGPLTPGTYTFIPQGQLRADTNRLLLQSGEFVAERIRV